MKTIYAIRQIHKGWSDIVYVCETLKKAKYYAKIFNNDNDDCNYKVEPITLL